MKLHTRSIAVFTLGVVAAGALTVYAATWQGTGSIRNGSIIEPNVLKEDLDYLYERIQYLEGQIGNTGQDNPLEGYKLKVVNGSEDSYGGWYSVQSARETCVGGLANFNAARFDTYTCLPHENRSCVDGFGQNTAFIARNVQCRQAKALFQE